MVRRRLFFVPTSQSLTLVVYPRHRQRQSVTLSPSRALCLTSFSLSTPRFVLASTQDPHEKINQLANRVRKLKDALRTSYTPHSLKPHPLLAKELLRIKVPIQRENLINTGVSNGTSDEPGADVVDSFGSLSISESGKTNYFGQATSSWVCFPRN